MSRARASRLQSKWTKTWGRLLDIFCSGSIIPGADEWPMLYSTPPRPRISIHMSGQVWVPLFAKMTYTFVFRTTVKYMC